MFKPLDDRILVKVEQKVQPKSSLFMPTQVEDKVTSGEVIAMGPGKYVRNKLVPPVLQIGDRVSFPMGIGSKIKIEGETYYVMFESDIVGVIK